MSRPFLLVLASTIGVVAALNWGLVRDLRGRPYSVDAAALSGWTVVLGTSEDPWVAALRPPTSLTTSLFRQLSTKVDARLVAAPHAMLPLVMRPEYDDALQGVYGAMDIQRMAREVMAGEPALEPVCVGRRVDATGATPRELYFLAVASPAFEALRLELRPDFPEHAGIGVYDPGALTPVVPIATTDGDLRGWWPIRLERLADCQAQVTVIP